MVLAEVDGGSFVTSAAVGNGVGSGVGSEEGARLVVDVGRGVFTTGDKVEGGNVTDGDDVVATGLSVWILRLAADNTGLDVGVGGGLGTAVGAFVGFGVTFDAAAATSEEVEHGRHLSQCKPEFIRSEFVKYVLTNTL